MKNFCKNPIEVIKKSSNPIHPNSDPITYTFYPPKHQPIKAFTYLCAIKNRIEMKTNTLTKKHVHITTNSKTGFYNGVVFHPILG